MNMQLMKQAVALMKQNRFYAIVSILGTAVSIAFVMVVYMVYDISTANIAPEVHRDRMIYSGSAYTYRTADHSNANSRMSLGAARQVFDSLPGAERVTYMPASRMIYAGASATKGSRRLLSYADVAFWKLYDIRFLAGRPFSREEWDANRDVVVIAERIARSEFGSATEAVGKNLFVNFRPLRVVGVTEDVSSLFSWAFSDLWRPYNPQELGDAGWSEGLQGTFTAMVLRRPDVSTDEMKAQIEASRQRLNSRMREFTLELNEISTVTERSFFRDFAASPAVIFVMLGMIMLVVPAINISGLISSQMTRRLSELGIRKAYGASARELVVQLMTENLLLALMGAVVGFLLSCLLMYLTKDWLLVSSASMGNMEQHHVSIFLFLRPRVFLCVFAVCLLFNLISVFIPAWNATRRNIITTLKGE